MLPLGFALREQSFELLSGTSRIYEHTYSRFSSREKCSPQKKKGQHSMDPSSGKGVIAVTTLGSFISFCLAAPVNVKTAGFIMLWLVIGDSILGILSAFFCRELKSHRMRTKFFIKILQYSGILLLTTSLTVLSKTYYIEYFGFANIMACEALSIIENLIRLQKHGGVHLGPVSPFIEVLAQRFDVGKDIVINSTTVVSGDSASGREVVNHTEVQDLPTRRRGKP